MQPSTYTSEASFLDLHLSISDGFVKNKIYDKQDEFDFDIVNFPFLDGDVPRSASPSNFYCWPSQGGSSVLVLW